MKPIEDPHQYPVQRGQRVRTAPRGRHLVDQVKGDQAIEPREARAEAKGEGLGRRVRKARGPRSGPLPVQDKFLITTTITDARRDELRARLETERLHRRIAARRDAERAAWQRDRTHAVRLIRALKAVTRGERTIQNLPLADARTVAHDALAYDGDIHDGLDFALVAYGARQTLKACERDLNTIFKRARGGEKFGVTPKQGRAWVLNEILDEHEGSAKIHKHELARMLNVDPSSAHELTEKAHRKLLPGGNLDAARAVLRRVAQIQAHIAGPLSDQEYDDLIGPTNRKGGRSAASVPAGDKAGLQNRIRGTRTPARKIRYGPGDKYGED